MNAVKERYRIQAEFCKSMAHPLRLEVIDLLRGRDLTVQEIAEEAGVRQANLSQHLAVLRNRGIVRSTRDGNNVIYTLANKKVVEACTLIREILSEQLDRQQEAMLSR